MIAIPSAVATPHPDATTAARLAIEQGGNAADAAAAAMLTLCVVMPQQVGIGGYGGSLVLHRAGQAGTVAIDFDTVAPKAFRAALYEDPKLAQLGALSISVPSVIAGLAFAVERYGSLPFGRACEYAAGLAARGFVISPLYHQQLSKWWSLADARSRRALFPDGRLPGAGETWVQQDKSKLLLRLANAGAQAFYHGDVPRTICAQLRELGGILSEADFASYRPRVVDPLSISYRGHTILTPPPPSGGLTTLQILKVLEHFDLPKVEPFSAGYFHLFAEATKLAWNDRHASAGDPEFVSIPVTKLLSESHARAIASRIQTGDIYSTRPEPPAGHHTANVLVSDRQGNLVSMTATQGFLFGSQVVIEGLGIVMNHGMSRFDFCPPDSPNAPAPMKRPFHNMSPTIVLDSHGRPRHAVGLPGGAKIVTVTAQLLIDMIDFGLSPEGAVQAPRVHVETADPIAASSGVSDATLAGLQAMGHKTVRGQTVGGPPTQIAGMANAMSIDPASRRPVAASQGEAGSALNF